MKTTIILRAEERKRLEKLKEETRLSYSAIIGNLILGRPVGGKK
jgi:hypothetical protein